MSAKGRVGEMTSCGETPCRQKAASAIRRVGEKAAAKCGIGETSCNLFNRIKPIAIHKRRSGGSKNITSYNMKLYNNVHNVMS